MKIIIRSYAPGLHDVNVWNGSVFLGEKYRLFSTRLEAENYATSLKGQ